MDTISQSLALALAMVAHLDPRLVQIVGLSLAVSLASTLCSAVIGLPLGAAVAIGRFPGRGAVIVGLNPALGLPPVFLDLAVYLMLLRSGCICGFNVLIPP